MKTHIKTKDLLSLIDPSTTGVIYEGNNVVVNLEELKKFVESPKTKNVFSESLDSLQKLYKNVALYILNPSVEPSIISIDLDSPNPIKNGLFEYLKAIYLEQSHIYLSLPETGDNLLFIKSKDIIDISQSPLDHPQYFKEAKDIQLGDLSSIFLQTKKLEPEALEKINKVTEGNKFYWKETNEDIYSNVDYILYETQEILKQNKYAQGNTVLSDLVTLFIKINYDLASSDEFKLKLLDLNDQYLNEKLFKSNEFARIKDFSIDLNKEVFQEKILSDIKNKRFQLLDFAFNTHIKYNKKNHTEIDTAINFRNLLNQPETIEHLVNAYYSSSFADYGNEKLTIVSAYPYFNKENKLSEQVINKYMESITRKTMNGDTYIAEDPLFKLPVELFQKEGFLNKVLPYVSADELDKFFKKHNVKSELLTDKNYLIKNAHNIHSYKIDKILSNFFDIKDIDKDFFKDLLLSNKHLFYYFFKDKDNSYNAMKYEHLIKDFDLIYDLADNGLTFDNIPNKIIKQYLLEDSQDKYKEQFKLDYLIHHQLLNKHGKALFDNPEEVKAFEKKFIRIENLFYSFRDYTFENKPRDNALGKIKTTTKIHEILNNIENVSTDAKFDSRSFYKALNPDLKNDTGIIERLMEFGKLSYTDLSESLQYNKEIVIKCIEQSYHTIKYIPTEFFNDTDFSIKFAKLIDNGNITIDQAPLFIVKFFENQGVEKDYSKYLKSYILASSINNKIIEEVPEDHNKAQTNKRKI